MSDVESKNDNLRRVFAFANVVLRHRWIVVALPLLAGTISVVRSLSQQRSYTSTATFMTQGATRPAATSMLAAQLGISVSGSADATLSPEFYADLLKSRPILEQTIRRAGAIASGDSTRSRTLAQYYGDEDGAVEAVRGGISTAISQKTGVVTLSVQSATPALAQQIGRELLHQLDEFNKQRRKSRVSAERQFTAARLEEAAAQLQEAEDDLQAFYTRNRDFATSPQLKLREDRLSRDVTLRQQLYSTLAQSYEQAKIDEVRDTPVITVLEEPVLPRHGNSRHTVDRALLALVLGLLLAIGLALLLESAKAAKLEKVDELEEFRMLGRQFMHEVRNPLTTARRVLS